MTPMRRFMLPAIASVALLLTACSAGDNADTGSAGAPGHAPVEHNAADIEFAQHMIPHHQQAVEMADLAEDGRAGSEVLALAGEIKAAQGPEIDTLSGWLHAWGAAAPDADGPSEDSDHADHAGETGESGESGPTGRAHTNADDDGHGEGMTGMLDDEQMAALADATGDTFDRRFLELMIEHHEGAVEMSRVQVSEGLHPEAVSLAEEIITAQEAEIGQMERLLDEG